MATGIDILVSQIQSKTKVVGLTAQKQIIQQVDFQGASQCAALCPYCQKDGHSGACGLNVGHTQQHQCNRDSTHRWNEHSPTDVPGPH